MTTTPRTDAAIIAADGRWTYGLKEEMQAMERELAEANERIRQLESILSERLIASYAPELLKKDNQ